MPVRGWIASIRDEVGALHEAAQGFEHAQVLLGAIGAVAAVVEQDEAIRADQFLVVHQVAQDEFVLVAGIDVHHVEGLDAGTRLDRVDGADGVGADDGDVVLVGEAVQALLVEVVEGGLLMHRAAVVVGVFLWRLDPWRQLVEWAVVVIGGRAPAVDQHHLFRGQGLVELHRVFAAQHSQFRYHRLLAIGGKHRVEYVIEGFTVGCADFHR